ncbi:MAG: DUF1015 domain-containing protein [Spirochaetes bacterium]|nr:DUF1015 domain-containing protein [Spirochaetota bacterium]
MDAISMQTLKPSMGIEFSRILLPRPGIDIRKWAVIACDQFTSQPEIWKELEARIGDSPSTLHCIYPECYLGSADEEERIKRIQHRMKEYIESGILVETEPGMVLVERKTPHTYRRGMVIALDLEQYDYRPGTKPLIRPTEQTVLERLPPRIKIRKGASIEFPHTLILLNDFHAHVIDALFSLYTHTVPTYDVELLLGAGRVRGWFIRKEKVNHILMELLRKNLEHNSFVYAVGDGNHSLASAKSFWEEMKNQVPPSQQSTHPARYTLAELVSLYDTGIQFHPIHRILHPLEPSLFLEYLRTFTPLQVQKAHSFEELKKVVTEHPFWVGLVDQRELRTVHLLRPTTHTVTEMVQHAIDAFQSSNPTIRVDYIHGDESFHSLSTRPNTIGIYLPGLPKEQLFPLIESEGILPRKAFSIGEALEKRFYLEGRKISVS